MTSSTSGIASLLKELSYPVEQQTYQNNGKQSHEKTQEYRYCENGVHAECTVVRLNTLQNARRLPLANRSSSHDFPTLSHSLTAACPLPQEASPATSERRGTSCAAAVIADRREPRGRRRSALVDNAERRQRCSPSKSDHMTFVHSSSKS
jgi:hypothetical protein